MSRSRSSHRSILSRCAEAPHALGFLDRHPDRPADRSGRFVVCGGSSIRFSTTVIASAPMRRDGPAMNPGNLTKIERAVRFEIERQLGGMALVPYSWFRMCVLNDPDTRQKLRPEFPSSERSLNRALTHLQKLGLVRRIGSGDRGAWYVLAEVWDQLSEEVQNEIRLSNFVCRGDKETISLLELGPAALPDPLCARAWVKVPHDVSLGVGGFQRPQSRNLSIGPLRGTLTPELFRQRVSADAMLVNLVFSKNLRRSRKGSGPRLDADPLRAGG